MLIKIQTYEGIKTLDVKILKCEVDNVCYCKRDNLYKAFDIESGLIIGGGAKRVYELIEKVNSQKHLIEKCRNNPEYKKSLLNVKPTLF